MPVTQWLWNTHTTPSLPHYLYMPEAIEKRAGCLSSSIHLLGKNTFSCWVIKGNRNLDGHLQTSKSRKHQDWTIGLHRLCSRFTWVDDRTDTIYHLDGQCLVSPVNKILARSVKWNEMQNDGSFLLITTTSDTVRYSRELSVHGKLESVTSSRRANLIRGFNTASKTNMVDAPSFFDSGEVAQAILLFDGLGPVIFGEHREDILDKEGEEATTEDMMDSYRRLPQTLMHVQNLSLKPLTKLISEEKDYLASQREDTVNPLVRYLTEELDAQIPVEESVGGCFDTTDLYVSQSGFHSYMLTVVQVATESESEEEEEVDSEDDDDDATVEQEEIPQTPPEAIHFLHLSDEERQTKTIQYIQTFEKDLTEEQQQLAIRAKNPHQNPHIGIRKGTQTQIKKEMDLHSKATKELRGSLGWEPTNEEVLRKDDRKSERREERQKEKRKKVRRDMKGKDEAHDTSFTIKSKHLQAKFDGPDAAR
ncbi:hypothetical protein DFH07DRAFT_942262 [Mycena maculata]|uniref:Uncharacterized protein n=1 Tax=Mycena maculata TaxID=230809 RepID=A0AAD7IQS3_9AGAR|nr:hypothetical protein DFH07DRAFT_942262 [Mycena maculata]